MSPPTIHELRTLVANVMSDDSELARLAGLSFRHPNGFDRLMIADDPASGARRRVHVWWDKDSSGAGHIHNHPSSFASRVLTGRLHVETYQAFRRDDSADANRDHVMFRCPPPLESAASFRWTYRIEGPVRLRSCGAFSLPAGSRYSQDFRAFHRVTAGDLVPTVSVVFHGRVQQIESQLVVHASASLADDRVVAKFAPDEFHDRLSRVIEALA